MPVIVVNARALDRVPTGYTLVYVGRSTSYRHTYGADFSVLGNPFTLASGYSRDEAVDAYADRAARGVPLIVRRAMDVLRERARTEALALVCFCAPQRCHADVIKAQLEGGQSASARGLDVVRPHEQGDGEQHQQQHLPYQLPVTPTPAAQELGGEEQHRGRAHGVGPDGGIQRDDHGGQHHSQGDLHGHGQTHGKSIEGYPPEQGQA